MDLNGLTVEQFNAREKKRASMVAKIYGYVPMAEGETEAGLYAEYEALMGKPLPNRQDELNRIRDDALAKRADRLAQIQTEQEQAVEDATANGFRDCYAVRTALDFEHVQFYVAYRWIEEAGFQIVYVVPDGSTTIRKALRTGCYEHEIPVIVAYKDEIYAGYRYDQDQSSRRQILESGASPAQVESWLGPPPPAPNQSILDAAKMRRDALAQAKQQAVKADQDALVPAVKSYTGPMNRRGLPKLRALNAHLATLGLGPITRTQRNQLWGPV